jgi:hypothetical protein
MAFPRADFVSSIYQIRRGVEPTDSDGSHANLTAIPIGWAFDDPSDLKVSGSQARSSWQARAS